MKKLYKHRISTVFVSHISTLNCKIANVKLAIDLYKYILMASL